MCTDESSGFGMDSSSRRVKVIVTGLCKYIIVIHEGKSTKESTHVLNHSNDLCRIYAVVVTSLVGCGAPGRVLAFYRQGK